MTILTHWYWSIMHKHTCKKEQLDLCNISVVSPTFCRCLLLLRCFSWEKDPRNHIYVSSRVSIYFYIYTLWQLMTHLCLFWFYVSEGDSSSEIKVILEAFAIKSQRYVNMNPSEVFSSDSPFYISYSYSLTTIDSFVSVVLGEASEMKYKWEVSCVL